MFNRLAIKELFEAQGLPFDVDDAGQLYPYPEPNAPTPQQTLDAEAIVAAHNPATLSKQQEIDQARAALAEIRKYLLKQLISATPETPTQQVAAMKAIANGNTYLAQIMSNQLTAMNTAFGWSLTNNPTTNQTRIQYIITIELLTGVLPQG